MIRQTEGPQQAPPEEWWTRQGGHASTAQYRAWLKGETPAKSAPKEGKHNAKSGTCPILKHRYRSEMERRFGLYLLFLGYQRWKDKTSEPPEGKWYAYERKAWEFPNIRGTNHNYTSDFECWPSLPDADDPRQPIRAYACYEVKGWMDPGSITKLKRMAKHFPDVPIVVVDQRVFKLYTHGAESLIEGWNLEEAT